jgi:hypothetical protein
VDEPQGRGRGLTGYYFDSIQCKGHDGNATRIDTWSLKGSRTDPRVHVNWGEESPGLGIGEDTFAVVWKGRFRAPRKGTYRFSATSDDGIKVFVDHQCLVDGWHNHQERTYESKKGVELEAGQFVPLSVEFYDIVYDARCTLYVQGPAISRRIVPREWLYPSSEPPFARFPELWEIGPGEYRSWFDTVDTGDYALAGDFNDSLSGLTVPPRYRVTLAYHYGMGGRKRSFDGPARFAEGLLKHHRLNDEVSSVRVETRGAYGK